MPVIYYTYYTPVCKSISAVSSQEHALGRELLRRGLKDQYSLSFSKELLDAAITIEKNGKPCLREYPGIHFNISHCDGFAACAFHSQSVGIDAELPGHFARVLIGKALSEEEKNFFQMMGTTPALEQEWFYRFWTLKEAYVKQTGTGLDVDLKGVSFRFSADPAKDGKLLVSCSDRNMCCVQKKLSQGQILSVCYPYGSEGVSLCKKNLRM